MESARYSVRNEPSERTIYIRMEGIFEESQMRELCKLYLDVTRSYQGQPHLVLADMRGMHIASLDVAKLLGEAIGEARKIGVACCAHLSSSTVQKLQAARLARENSPDDDVTVNVVSPEEAHKVLEEARLWLGSGGSQPSPMARGGASATPRHAT
jgi:hypothetical protein